MTRKLAMATLIIVLAATGILAALFFGGKQVSGKLGGPDWSQLYSSPSP